MTFARADALLGGYQYNGHLGGQKRHTGGFFAKREQARIAGARGGLISRRTKRSDGQ